MMKCQRRDECHIGLVTAIARESVKERWRVRYCWVGVGS